MKHLIYIILFLPFTGFTQQKNTATVNGWKTYLESKQVNITHYFIDPENVENIRTEREVREVYITLKKKNNLVRLSDFVANTKSQFEKLKDSGNLTIIINGNLIEKPETYFIEGTAITAIETYINNGEDHTAHTPTISIMTKNKEKI